MTTHTMQPPKAVGLYDPRFEHDACGVGMVARLDNTPTHEVVERGIAALKNLEHRGASGADPCTGDGAGILMQMPDELLRAVVEFELPPAGRYGVLMCFLPAADESRRARLEELLERTVRGGGPDGARLARRAGGAGAHRRGRGRLPSGDPPAVRRRRSRARLADQDAFERKLYVIRRVCELSPEGEGLYVASSSSRTLNYKGMLISCQLAEFYPDLRDERCKSALALVHSRFSTNTFPSWELAHPYRTICHNGEINTVMGNVNWMRARESELSSELFGADLQKILPVVTPGNSDSATFDNVMELLLLAGRSPAHAAMMMIPEAYRDREDLPADLVGFYAYHACLMEPWDGPASVAFTDGRVVGATLDRNGLRPGRWVETADGHVVLGSETGMLDVAPSEIKRLGRLQPGKLFLVDLQRGRIVEDGEVKRELSTRRPYREWFQRSSVAFEELEPSEQVTISDQPLHRRQRAFGFTQEDLRVLLAPMARDGAEPIGSMGNDISLAVLSDQAPPLFSYFKQLFAQVTNPPIDPIREEIVMSLQTTLGSERNLFEETPEHAHKLVLERPILLNRELETLRHVSHELFAARTIDITWPVAEGAAGMRAALDRVCEQAHDAISAGVNIIVLSDRSLGPRRAPIPSLLAVASVHHHLVREGTRLRVGIVLESGEPREVHHFATLIGYGASAINPYLMLETLDELVIEGRIAPGAGDGAPNGTPLTGEELNGRLEQAAQNTIKAIGKGLLKTISKMGISTIQSYRGAQIFEAVGLERELIERHFTGTASRIGGVGLDVLATEALERHARAYPAPEDDLLPVGGVYAWRRDGEHHMWNPETIALVQHAVRAANGNVAAALAGRGRGARRGALERRVREVPGVRARDQRGRGAQGDAARAARVRAARGRRCVASRLPLEEVEPASEIVQALLHRRDEPRLDLARGARDARDRDEPARRALEHGRGWRGPRALRTRPQRRSAAFGDQAGRLGPLRRDDQLPRQRGRAADQDGPGRQARRGRPAAGRQGRRVHRLDPPHDPGRGPDLAAAPPRHLLDRGPQAADLRPALLQPPDRTSPARRCRSSSSPRSASARSPRACPRPTPTAC